MVSIFTARTGIRHGACIPLNQISEIETREGWFSQQIILSYVDENGTVHRLKLIPKKREVFLEALKLRPGFEKYPHSPWN